MHNPYDHGSFPPAPQDPPLQAAPPHPPSLGTLFRIARLLGIHPLVAFVLFGCDWMLGALEVISFGLFVVLSLLVGLLVIPPCAVVQRQSYGDSWGPAIAKATIVGILLAIPSPLPSVLTIGLGAAGFIGMKHGNNTH